MRKCVFEMTPDELLAEGVTMTKPERSLLIVDRGGEWEVTEYSPDSAGLGTEHITIQAAIEKIEYLLVKMRRSHTAVDVTPGEVITDGGDIIKELTER